MALRQARFVKNLRILSQVRMMSDGQQPGWGSGAGKGGGSGGTVREAGGAFGKMEAAHEEQYFRRLQQEQLANLKKSVSSTLQFHKEQIEFHKEQISDHSDAIDKHKKAIKELEDLEK